MSKTVCFLIDGFNLYHSVRDAEKKHHISAKWLNIHSLCKSYLPTIRTAFQEIVELKNIYYFSAFAYHMEPERPHCIQRHRLFLQCLQNTGIIPILGQFKKKVTFCPLCKRIFYQHEEKETDVAISMKLIELFITQECDIAVIMTGDTDLTPAVKITQKLFPYSLILFAFPAFRKNKILQKLCPHSFEIKSKQYANHQFPNPYILKNGKSIHKPESW